MRLEYDKNSLIIDGKRVLIRSAALHYFRLPGEYLWQDRLSKLAAMGYNTVDLYICWNFHSEKKGEYNFEGIRDIRKLLEITKRLGLYVIIRPGPFINAEVNAGGLPFWLLEDKDVIPRNRTGSDYQYSKPFMDAVAQYYDNIIPIINDFDNIIIFQVENEYSTHNGETEYIEQLRDMAKERGVKAPISHNDAYIAGLYADCVDIYACDIYPYINPAQDWKKENFCFDTLDNLESIVRMYTETSPIYVAELQAGWFDKWDGKGYAHIREALGGEHINIMTKTALAQGVTIFNHYMGAGGTSFEDIACDEVYTSYDFASGIDEYGVIQQNGKKAKNINYFLSAFNLCQTEALEENQVLVNEKEELIYAVQRKDKINSCDWLFVRNLFDEERKITLKNGLEFVLKPFDMKILPVGLDLNACRIEFSGYEIFTKTQKNNKQKVFLINAENAVIEITDAKNQKEIFTKKFESHDKLTYKKGELETEVIFISEQDAYDGWLLGDKLIIGCDFVRPDGKIALSEAKELLIYGADSDVEKKFFDCDCSEITIPLNSWYINTCAPEIDEDYDYSSWKPIKDSTDILSNGIHSEFIFYKACISDKIKELTLSARHLFGVYINGNEIINRNSYKTEKLRQVEETISISLDEGILNKEKNQLTILVQNLGFDKGFCCDTNLPRGLVRFETVPYEKVDFKIRDNFCFQNAEIGVSESQYLIQTIAEFDYTADADFYRPLCLKFEKIPFSRCTIFLNDIKIGRYLKNQLKLDKFYLPQGFLKDKNCLKLVIWEKNLNITHAWDFKSCLKDVIIKIETIKSFELVDFTE